MTAKRKKFKKYNRRSIQENVPDCRIKKQRHGKYDRK